MINILNLIFNAFGYMKSNTVVNEYSGLYIKEGGVQDEFFIVADITHRKASDIDPLQAELHASLNEFFNLTDGAEKNTNLVLLKKYEYKGDAKSQGVVNRKISEIEENPYFFKKSLIVYNEEELVSLNEALIADKPDSIADALALVMQNYARFINFRERDDDVLFRVISKLYTKIPFLTYNLSPEKQINLSFEIEAQLKKIQLHEECMALLSVVEDDQVLVDAWIASLEGGEDV